MSRLLDYHTHIKNNEMSAVNMHFPVLSLSKDPVIEDQISISDMRLVYIPFRISREAAFDNTHALLTFHSIF